MTVQFYRNTVIIRIELNISDIKYKNIYRPNAETK